MLLRESGTVLTRSVRGAGGGTMGQVCFTAISPNRACPTVFIALSSVFQIIALCDRCPSVQWLGLRAKVPSSLRLCTRSAVACWAVGWQTCSQAHARTPGHFSIGSGVYMQVRGHQWAGTCFRGGGGYIKRATTLLCSCGEDALGMHGGRGTDLHLLLVDSGQELPAPPLDPHAHAQPPPRHETRREQLPHFAGGAQVTELHQRVNA